MVCYNCLKFRQFFRLSAFCGFTVTLFRVTNWILGAQGLECADQTVADLKCPIYQVLRLSCWECVCMCSGYRLILGKATRLTMSFSYFFQLSLISYLILVKALSVLLLSYSLGKDLMLLNFFLMLFLAESVLVTDLKSDPNIFYIFLMNDILMDQSLRKSFFFSLINQTSSFMSQRQSITLSIVKSFAPASFILPTNSLLASSWKNWNVYQNLNYFQSKNIFSSQIFNESKRQLSYLYSDLISTGISNENRAVLPSDKFTASILRLFQKGR